MKRCKTATTAESCSGSQTFRPVILQLKKDSCATANQNAAPTFAPNEEEDRKVSRNGQQKKCFDRKGYVIWILKNSRKSLQK